MNVLPVTWRQAFTDISVNDTRVTKLSAPPDIRLSAIAWNRIGSRLSAGQGLYRFRAWCGRPYDDETTKGSGEM